MGIPSFFSPLVRGYNELARAVSKKEHNVYGGQHFTFGYIVTKASIKWQNKSDVDVVNNRSRQIKRKYTEDCIEKLRRIK